MLIEKEIDVNTRNLDNYTPLQLANSDDDEYQFVISDDHYTELVIMLLMYGADPSIKIDLEKFNHFELAVKRDRSYVVQEVLFYYI